MSYSVFPSLTRYFSTFVSSAFSLVDSTSTNNKLTMMKPIYHHYRIMLFFSLIMIAGSCSDDSDDQPKEEVMADFSISATDINVEEEVNFTDLSTGQPTSWSWVFEGGEPESSQAQNPSVIFKQAGTLSVTLTVSNGNSEDVKSMDVTATCSDTGASTFENFNKMFVQYGTSRSHEMMVYQPQGDTRCTRPAIVLFVGGGVGNPNSLSSIESMAIPLVKSGYVVGIGRFRTGNTSGSSDWFRMLIRNQQDIKAAVRFLRSKGETYRIGDNQIFSGGHGSGGIISLFAAYTTRDEIQSDFLSILDEEGGLEGTQGNSEYSSSIAGVFSSSGAVYDVVDTPLSIDQGEPPVFAVHGENDIEISPDCSLTPGGAYECGSRAIVTRAQSENIVSELFIIPNGSHSSPRLNPELYMDNLVSFLDALL
jgi:PKD repeat protein